MTSSEPDPLLAIAESRVGTVLKDKYRLDGVLGVGGMAAVYKVTHRNQAEFALKMLHPELSLREDVRTRFLREGYAANSVKHPGAVHVVDDDVTPEGVAFLVMELLAGMPVETLREGLGGRLPVQATLSVGDQLLDVLAAAHDKGIVHRDVKPENLFVTTDGTLKVLDFGIARVREATSGGSRGTATGALLGTPAFMSPEQAYGRATEVDGQTDLWAVGATLFTLLTGELVHAGETVSELMIHAATIPARSLSSVAIEAPEGLARIIDTATAFEKGSRWPSAAAMRDALRELSVRAYGEPPNRAHLAALVQGKMPSTSDVVAAPTFMAPSTPAASSLGPRAVITPAPLPGSSVESDVPSRAPTAPLPAVPGPVESRTLPGAASSPPEKRGGAALFVVAGAAVVALFAAAGVYALRRPHTTATITAAPILDAAHVTDAACRPDDGGDCGDRCAKGEAKACASLAAAYMAGNGVPKDDAHALTLYEQACEGNELSACSTLGFMMKTGSGAGRDDARAASLFKKACEGGNPAACGGLGQMYEAGLGGVTRDEVQAVALYSKGCDAKDPMSCAHLGHMYMRGKGVAHDDAKALPLVKQGCDAGGPFWCANLGILLMRGRGVVTDEARAVTLFDKSCTAGSPLGCAELGSAYATGRGAPKDMKKAVPLFEKACKDSVMSACIGLADAYTKGDGVTKDPVQAVSILTKSCDSGALGSCAALGKHYADGVGVAKSQTRAVELFDKSCPNKTGEPWCAATGYVLEQNKRPKQAIAHYRTGCERDDEWCCAQLKRLGAPP